MGIWKVENLHATTQYADECWKLLALTGFNKQDGGSHVPPSDFDIIKLFLNKKKEFMISIGGRIVQKGGILCGFSGFLGTCIIIVKDLFNK